MTKAELIKQLQESPAPDNWKIKVVQKTWIEGVPYPSEEIFDLDSVGVIDEGEIGLDFYTNEPDNV